MYTAEHEREVSTAAAIEWNRNLTAPIVVARGKGQFARNLVSIAKKHGIHVEKNDVLAETLVELDPGSAIPVSCYEMVARILIFIHGLDKNMSGR